MDNTFITIDLALPIYLVKYRHTLYGETQKPTAQDEIGIYILHILERKNNVSEYQYSFKNKQKSTYNIHISLSRFYKSGGLIEKNKKELIKKYIDSHFRNEIYRNAVLNYYNFHISYKNTIITALQAYNISESDLAYETIRKDFNRKKKYIENKIIK